MNKEIIKYVNTENNNFNNNILFRLGTDDYVKQLVEQMKTGKYFILILWFLLFFILISITFLNILTLYVQFILDLCLIIMFLSSIYLCECLNNPFVKTPLSLNLDIYDDLLN